MTQQTAWQCGSVLQLQAREGCTCKRDKLFSYSSGQAKGNKGGSKRQGGGTVVKGSGGWGGEGGQGVGGQR